MLPYKIFHVEPDSEAIKIVFEKCDSLLSERVFTINSVNFSDVADDSGGGFVEFNYTYVNDKGENVGVSDPEVEAAMEDVFRDIISGMITSLDLNSQES